MNYSLFQPNISEDQIEWFVLRELKRSNSNVMSWMTLQEKGFEVFTPLHWKLFKYRGRNIRKKVPVISDLLFVKSCRRQLDDIIAKTPTLQYRFTKNCGGKPMVISERDMERFMIAVADSDKVKYYLPEELSSLKCGKEIKIIGGPLNGYTGKLLSVRGSKIKRLMVELPQFLTAAVEVDPEFIELI